MDRIFINVYNYKNDWIMGKIAEDIQKNATLMGYECHCGGIDNYDGEEICYHLNYALAVPIPQARHNSIFYTHLNHKLSEKNLLETKGKFDSYVCMSPEDAQFLIELGFDQSKVYGKTLPVRNTYIRPISIGIFSACYPDGRKNEQWLIDFCSINKDTKLVNFVFIGKGWGHVVEELEKMGVSFEWHNVSRQLPYEYQYQQNLLPNLNYYIYMGMDGGAMGTYDAYAQDVPLCVTYDGFHKSIMEIDYSFDDREGFFQQMNIIISKQRKRIDFFLEHDAGKYVSWIINVWEGALPELIDDREAKCLSFNNVLEKKRKQYYKINITRLINYFSWNYLKAQYRRKIGKKK